MADRLRFLAAGSDALLVELDDLEATLSLLDALQADRPEGVIDLVPAARTLLVCFDRSLTSRTALVDRISGLDLSRRRDRQGETFEIPVVYDGEDLADVAGLLGWTVEELIHRHTQATYTVAFTGFAPGFAYLAGDDPAFDVPRRKSPRVRVPAGSVAIGGRFCGVYPTDSPGGWQLLGRTPLAMWDASRPRAALLAPGDRVRFRVGPMETGRKVSAAPVARAQEPAVGGDKHGLRVIRADRPALLQDLGRPGQAGQGVAPSGALDPASLIEANLCVGNPRGAAAVEIAYGGFALVADRPVTLAVTGAPTPLTIRTADGRGLGVPNGRPFALDAGDELTLGFPADGTRSYLALRGGFDVEQVLGSAATDTLAKIGPAPILGGDVLVPADRHASPVDPDRPVPATLPKASDRVVLDIVLGPRTDWFSDRGLAIFLGQDWQVTAASSRVGIRLSGQEPVERAGAAELPSEGTARGAIQVAHDGQPVLFLADHPLTGGYPVIGVVAAHHLGLAGQIPIGARIRFNVTAAFDPIVRNTDR